MITLLEWHECPHSLESVEDIIVILGLMDEAMEVPFVSFLHFDYQTQKSLFINFAKFLPFDHIQWKGINFPFFVYIIKLHFVITKQVFDLHIKEFK